MVQIFLESLPSPIQKLFELEGVSIHVKRDDLIDNQVSGNKLYKLALNIDQAQHEHFERILTFGGAYSNHIAATARYCKMVGMESIGVIRGEPTEPLNPTLRQAEADGMQLYFVTRTDYRRKEEQQWLNQLRAQFDNPYIIPEGGANLQGILGAKEILDERTARFSHIYVGVGTGTTLAGLAIAAQKNQEVCGVVVHKHIDIWDDVRCLFFDEEDIPPKPRLITDMHLGGFGKWNERLIETIREVKRSHGIQLDPIYTGKVWMAIEEDIKHGIVPKGSSILMIHTGGLQGLAGFGQRFGIDLTTG